MRTQLIVGSLLLLELLLQATGTEIFGRRRQTGARRRAGARPTYGVSYGLSNTVWYIIIGVGAAFFVALIGSIIYYFLVIKKREKKRKEELKFKPIGAGYDMRSKAQKDKEMEEYLAKVHIPQAKPAYRDFETMDADYD